MPVRIITLLILIMALSGCTASNVIVAMNRSTDHFKTSESNGQVMYEAGAEATAQLIGKALARSIHTVEQKQYAPFPEQVKVYICASQESMTDYCVYDVAGCILNERLFIGPKADGREISVLTHELSHLNMEQRLGMFDWHRNTPAWFQEGLAVFVSGNGGAEKVSMNEAKAAIIQGKSFTPNHEGALIYKRTASTFGLKTEMFYRQAGMFVDYLHDSNASAFEKLIHAIVARHSFDLAIADSYGQTLDELWKDFLGSLNKDAS